MQNIEFIKKYINSESIEMVLKNYTIRHLKMLKLYQKNNKNFST
jgi:hypothetical protein